MRTGLTAYQIQRFMPANTGIKTQHANTQQLHIQLLILQQTKELT
jgi:hypothetical protein